MRLDLLVRRARWATWSGALPLDGFDQQEAGLGLSIVQSLITGDLHGSCDVQGPPGAGTSVRVRVPDPR